MAGQVNNVQVSVDDKGNVTCSPDPVRVQGANALLVFEMTSPDWTFTESAAITVKDPGKPLSLQVKVNYLTCDDVCIPYSATLTLDLPPGAAMASSDGVTSSACGVIMYTPR